MGSAVGQVSVVTPGMRQSMTSFTAHSPRLVYHLGWSPLAYQDRMARVTLVPWSSGRPLVWDATCPDTFSPSHRGHATQSAGCVGEQAEGKKAEKYAHLAPAYLFQPVAIETYWVAFLRELGRRVGALTGEARSTGYLFQRLSVAIQRGNAAAVMGCAPRPG